MAEVTRLLEAVRAGDDEAREPLFRAVYDELRGIARRRLSRESTLTHLDAAALVNEAYLRLARNEALPGANRLAFLAYASTVMRSVIVDYVRERNAAKRGDGLAPITLATDVDGELPAPEVEGLHDALIDLHRIDQRAARVVELRFFGGLSTEEVATELAVSVATVGRDWERARSYLYRAMRN